MSINSKIESLLFISAKPMSVKQLAELLKKDEKAIKKAGEELVEHYKESEQGVHIIKNGNKFQMVSSPENTEIVQEFIKDETTGELTRPSLETLTIIAYRGPISKIDLDRIRGVNCSLIVRNLLLRGLIEARVDKNKDETYFKVTFDFIRFLGINDISELPDYERLSKDEIIDQVIDDATENKTEKIQIEDKQTVEDNSIEKNTEDEKASDSPITNDEQVEVTEEASDSSSTSEEQAEIIDSHTDSDKEPEEQVAEEEINNEITIEIAGIPEESHEESSGEKPEDDTNMEANEIDKLQIRW